MLQEIADAVVAVYNQLDDKVSSFAASNALRCPEGCGRCCQSEKVEATVLEMLPLAFHLFETNQAELLIKRLESFESHQCILYRLDWSQERRWGCSQYEHRAVVCRLFGYAGNRDKEGEKRFARCPQMAIEAPGVELPTAVAVRNNCPTAVCLDEMVVFAEAGLLLTSLHPGLGTIRLPINEALFEALQKVGIYLYYNSAVSVECGQPELPPEKPVAPSGRRRKKAA